MTCPNPIDAALLSDHWSAVLPETEAEAIELHLLKCDFCGARLREIIALSTGLRELALSGALRMVVSDAYLASAAAHGLRIRQYAPPPGGAVQCTVSVEDDLLIARLAADLTGAKRVDLCVYDENGAEVDRLADIPIYQGSGPVLYQESITFAKAAPSGRMMIRLVTPDDPAGERLLGEFTFHHVRTI